MLKRGQYGIYHYMSPKHLNRYVNEFTGRKNIRQLPTLDQMNLVAQQLTNKKLTYTNLIA